MQAACDIAFEYAHIRSAFGKKIGQFQVKYTFRFYDFFSIINDFFKVVTRKNGRHVHHIKLLPSLFVHCCEIM